LDVVGITDCRPGVDGQIIVKISVNGEFLEHSGGIHYFPPFFVIPGTLDSHQQQLYNETDVKPNCPLIPSPTAPDDRYSVFVQRLGTYRNRLPGQLSVPLLRAVRLVHGRCDQLGAHHRSVHVRTTKRDFVRRVLRVQKPGVTVPDEFSQLVLIPFTVLRKPNVRSAVFPRPSVLYSMFCRGQHNRVLIPHSNRTGTRLEQTFVPVNFETNFGKIIYRSRSFCYVQ